MATDYQYIPQSDPMPRQRDPRQAPTMTPVQELRMMMADAFRASIIGILTEPPLGGVCNCPYCDRRRAVQWERDNAY